MNSPPAPTGGKPPCRQPDSWAATVARLAATAALIVGYYFARGPFQELVAGTLDSTPARVFAVTALLVALLAVWWKVVVRNPPLHAPILITAILALFDTSVGVLENITAPQWLEAWSGGAITEYNPTFITMAVTCLCELVIGRFYWGKWPNLASAYISGISAGILVKSGLLWPFVLCGLISITSKYVLRIGSRHLWNPTNFGMTVMLFLASNHMASLTVQAGNNGWAVALIWLFGGMVMYKLGRFHIPFTFIAAFIPLAILRSQVTGDPWQTEVAPITSPMFQLYIFFMITDPKTTVRGKWKQVIFTVVVAVAETAFRLALKDIYSLYHALFVVGPVANLIEIYADRAKARKAKLAQPPVPTTEAPASPPATAPASANEPPVLGKV